MPQYIILGVVLNQSEETLLFPGILEQNKNCQKIQHFCSQEEATEEDHTTLTKK
jgi:hypothetical protein